jgi:hypothetical protein
VYRREHSQCQTVDLEDAEGVDVVLVPFDEGSIGHGRVFDGNHFTQRPSGDDESAHVLGQMTGEADELSDQLSQHTNGAVRRVKARFTYEIL